MQTDRLPAVLLALVLTPAVAVVALSLGAPSARAVQEQDVHQKAFDDFATRFNQFLKVQDTGGMASLVGKNTDVAVRYADWICQQIAEAGSDELEKQVAALRIAWKESKKTDFVGKLYEYHSLLEPLPKKERKRLVEAFDRAGAKANTALASDMPGPVLETLSFEYAALADGFSKVGDYLNEGRCWTWVGACKDDGLRGKDANLYEACQAYLKAIAAYDKVQLVSTERSQTEVRLEHLVTNGYSGDEPDPDAPKEGQPDVAKAGPATANAMSFEAIEKIDTYQRPSYFADDLYQIWNPLGLAAKGTSATFNSMPERSPRIERTASAQFTVHDASGEEREPVTVTGNLTVVEATLEENGQKRPWAFVVISGLQEDTYQGRKTNMAPSQEYMSLFYFNAASVLGEVNGLPVRVLDDNLDGIYGSPPLRWQYIGLVKDAVQPDLDSIVIGKSKRALPWSEFQKIGDGWFKLEAQQGGQTLVSAPVELETGTVKLQFKGTFPTFLVVRGTGVLENCYFDLCANGKKPAELPVGEYELFVGMLRKGKKQQAMKCLILPPDQMEPWKVEAGKELVVELGGPYRFDFTAEKGAEEVTVHGPSVQVLGAAGEKYDRFWNCVPEPAVSQRKAGGKSGSKGEDMPKVMGDLDELTETGQRRWSYFDVWRPMNLTLPRRKGTADGVELQLTEKKNKLFGKIESDWK